MRSEEEELVITKFKRYGNALTPKSLERTLVWLRENPANSLKDLLQKLTELSFQSSNFDDKLQHAIEILSLNSKNSKNLNSYDALLQQNRKRSIYAISPYEYDSETYFTQRPNPSLFSFLPEDKLKNSQAYFKRLTECNKDVNRNNMMGIIYENYSVLTSDNNQKIMMQNQVNQFQLNFQETSIPQCLVVPGCTYIAEGYQEGKDLSLRVKSIKLPKGPPEPKKSLLKDKFKQMCQNISAGKSEVGFESSDFVKYDCVFTPPTENFRPTLVFGNVTINTQTVQRLKRLISAYPKGVTSVILMLSPEEQEPIDLSVWFKCKIYLVPHLASEGPRLLPKLPLLKTRIPGAKVLTNPARLCLQGKELVLANYPLLRTIFSQGLFAKGKQMSQQQIGGKVSELVFSQGTILAGLDHYWPQYEYFNIHSETILIVTDSVDVMSFYKSGGKVGGLANTGNFQRDGDFLCLMSWIPKMVQLSGQQKE